MLGGIAAVAILSVVLAAAGVLAAAQTLAGRRLDRRRYRALCNVAVLLGSAPLARDAEEVGKRRGRELTYRLITRRY